MNKVEYINLLSDLTNIPTEHITLQSRFKEDLGIDSLNMVNLFIQLSDRTGLGFNQIISAEDVLTAGSVYQIIIKEKK